MSKKIITKKYDIKVIGGKNYVDFILQNKPYKENLRLEEYFLSKSATKDLYIKERLREIKKLFPERPLNYKEPKTISLSTKIHQAGYRFFILYPEFSVSEIVEFIYRSFPNDFFNDGKYHLPPNKKYLIGDKTYFPKNKRIFKNKSESDHFDNIVNLLSNGACYAGIESYLNKKNRELTTTKPVYETKAESKIINSKYKRLRALFINDSAYTECMEALRNVKDPVISGDNRYLLGSKQKGAFTAWFEVLKLRQKFKEVPTAALLATMLNKEISKLNLYKDGSTLNRNTTSMYKKYYVPLSKLIS